MRKDFSFKEAVDSEIEAMSKRDVQTQSGSVYLINENDALRNIYYLGGGSPIKAKTSVTYTPDSNRSYGEELLNWIKVNTPYVNVDNIAKVEYSIIDGSFYINITMGSPSPCTEILGTNLNLVFLKAFCVELFPMMWTEYSFKLNTTTLSDLLAELEDVRENSCLHLGGWEEALNDLVSLAGKILFTDSGTADQERLIKSILMSGFISEKTVKTLTGK